MVPVPDSPAEDEILAVLLEALDRGEDPDLDALCARFPSDAGRIEDLYRAARRYHEFAGSVRTLKNEVLLQPGDRLGEFEVVELLARGGMSVVYRARQPDLGNRKVALKVLPSAGETALTKARFRREACLLGSLHHPNLAEVYGFGEEGGHLYYSMQLVEGETLRQKLEQAVAEGTRTSAPPHPWTPRQVVRWAVDVAQALEVIHASALVHRDVKPSNIVLERRVAADASGAETVAVLVDFGLARSTCSGSLTLTGLGLATLGYAPPEQILGKEVGASADVFALGATLHDLLSVRTPEMREHASAGLESLEEQNSEVDPELAAVVARAVDPQAKWRYPDASALLADLSAWLEGRPVSARRRGRLKRMTRWTAEHSDSILLWAGLAVLVVLGLFGFLEVKRLAETHSRAQTAFERGDLLQLANRLEDIGALARWPVLRNPELVRIAERVDAGRADDPLVRMLSILRGGQWDDALYEAATRLRVGGPDYDPAIHRFLLAALRGEGGAGSVFPRSRALQDVALSLCARLFYERPNKSGADDRSTEGFRVALRKIAFDESRPEHQRLEALTALSGCGTAQDLYRMIDLALRSPANSELRRLGLLGTEKTVRRLHARGALEEVDLSDLWESALPFARPLLLDNRLGEDEKLGWNQRGWLIQAMGRLIRALTLARRRVEPAGFELGFLREGSAPRNTAHALQIALDYSPLSPSLFVLLIAAGDPIVEPILINWIGPLRGHWDDWRNGEFCGLLGDEGVTERALGMLESAEQQGRLSAAQAADARARFLDGLNSGAAERIGVMRSLWPDGPTLLGFPRDEALDEMKELPVKVISQSGETGVLASFDLRPLRARLEGAARGITVLCSTQDGATDSKDVGYLLMNHFGESLVRFEFELEDVEPHMQLVLRHLAAQRPYLPYQGLAYIDVTFDGLLVANALLVSQTQEHEQVIDLPADRLVPGPHTVEIRLDRRTTTTYRIHRAELRRDP